MNKNTFKFLFHKTTSNKIKEQRTSQIWDVFSEKYERKIQKNTSVYFLTLLNMLRYEEANNILDAGCGAGYLHPLMINSKKDNANLYAFDFSPKMIQRAAIRMKRNLISKNNQLSQEEVQNINIDDEIFKIVNYYLSIGNIENLIQYSNQQFDIYISNLVIQIVENQQKAMQEAFRVLKPGGKIGISVWGSKQNCISLWLQKEAAYESGISKDGIDNTSFLNSNKELIALAKDVGFQNILCWKQEIPFDILDVKTELDFINPEIEALLSQASKEQQQLFIQILEKKIQQYHINYQPLPFESYLLIANKPL